MGDDLEGLNPKLVDREDGLANEEDDAGDSIPVVERGCTDIFCLFVFLLYVAGMLGFSFVGYIYGDPSRLIRATDYEGKLCGGEDRPNEPFVSYPRANEDVALSGFLTDQAAKVSFFGVCVSECPQAGDYVCTPSAETQIVSLIAANPTLTRDQIVRSCVSFPVFNPLSCLDREVHRGCFDTFVDTQNVFFRCLPDYVYETEILPESGCVRFKNISTTNGVESVCVVYKEVTKVTREQPTAGNLLFDTFNTYYRWSQTLMGDVMKARWPILGCALGVTTGVGLLYVMSLRCCVGFVVWISVISTLLASVAFTLFCYVKAGVISSEVLADAYSGLIEGLNDASTTIESNTAELLDLNQGENSTYGFDLTAKNTSQLPPAFTASLEYQEEFTYLAYGLTALTVLLFVIVIGLFEKILKAIEVFEVASKAIQHNFALMIVPFVSTFFTTAVIAAWSASTAYVATAAEFEVKTLNGTVSINPDDSVVEFGEVADFSYTNIAVGYMFFGILWVLNFINGVTIMTVSGTVLQWFWNSNVVDNKTTQSTRMSLMRAFGRTMRYHLGTVALGSFILAFVQFIRYLAAYLQKRLNSMGKDHRVVKILCCAAQCFLGCVQRCIEFISRNAFIWSAMYGTGFMTSTKNSFFAITSNIALVAMVTFLGDVIQRFGQLFATLLSGMAVWVWLDYDPQFGFGGENQLNSFVFPVLITMFFAWFIAAEILSVYDVTVDTILLSYVQDKRLKKFKADHQERAPEELHDFMDKNKLSDPKLIKQASFNTFSM